MAFLVGSFNVKIYEKEVAKQIPIPIHGHQEIDTHSAG